MNIQELFRQGMSRTIPTLISPLHGGVAFDLGASGEKVTPGAAPLGLPDWSFPRDSIPADDETVDTLYAYHFLEHLTGEDAIALLAEAERVLVKGGVMNICVPFYNSSMQAQDLTHKSAWCETSFKTLFDNGFYNPAGRDWRLKVHACFIMGVVERNLALFAQLVKE